MIGKVVPLIALAFRIGLSQTPAGRWDGNLVYDALKIPFSMHFEGSGTSLTGAFVNGDSRVASTSGSFEAGSLKLAFDKPGVRLEAVLKEGELKGVVESDQRKLPFTANAYCTCGSEGEAGPDIAGSWTIPDAGWRLSIRRNGEDTLVMLTRSGKVMGPLAGRFDGLAFLLHYFDGANAALLELEPANGGLSLTLKEPGSQAERRRAVRESAAK
jgi:hypothetical protein